MLEHDHLQIRLVEPQQFHIAADFWLAMRRELKMADEELPTDWKPRAIAYFRRRHAAGELAWFFSCDGAKPIASAAGFLLDGYPSEICTRRRVGYVAGVFVQPQWRRRGVGRSVTQAAIAWLQNIGCNSVRLHAADNARPIYEALGFMTSNEMVLQTIGD